VRRATLLGAAFWLVAIPAARADLLHLQGGGVIAADHWWIEGETLHVESAGGSVGLPRTMLVSVETVAPVAPREPSAGTASPPAKPPASPLAAAPPLFPPTQRAVSETAVKMAEGNAALAARDYERAALLFHDVVDEQPDAPGPRVGYALAEMALGRDASALPVVLDGLVRDPGAADLHEVLGSLRDREERVDDALASWREAFRLAPSDRVREKIMKAERELAAGRDYEYSAAAHFTLRYDGALDQDLVASLTDFLEDSFRSLTQLYRHAPAQPITVLLYPQQAFRDVTRAGHEIAGLFDGKIRVPLGGLTTLHLEARRVLLHELTHAIIQSKTHGNCPRWLNEGLAQVAEPRSLRRADIAKLARNVRADDPSTWPDKAFTYPAGLSLTRFLEARRGFDILVRLLDRLGDGDTPDAAFSAEYGASYAELAAAWAESLHSERGE
jgi:tetratricopeptide (TPR) repeat protein